jgi:hypothetical protein
MTPIILHLVELKFLEDGAEGKDKNLYHCLLEVNTGTVSLIINFSPILILKIFNLSFCVIPVMIGILQCLGMDL